MPCGPPSSPDHLLPFDRTFGEAKPDVVHVCTPPAAHFEAAHAALEGDAHVYVEKPFALTVRDARALLELASSRGLIVCSGHQLLCDPAFETLAARAEPTFFLTLFALLFVVTQARDMSLFSAHYDEPSDFWRERSFAWRRPYSNTVRKV